MTNIDINSNLDIIAAALDATLTTDDAPDMLDTLAAMRPLLAPMIFDALMLRLDCCPLHMTDLDICRDDELIDCRPFYDPTA